MQVALSELKLNIDYFMELSKTSEIIITKYGKPTAKLVCVDYEPWYEKEIPGELTSISQLFGTLPPDIKADEIRSERLGL